ncbi:zf-HC2 domain-containing protein [Devosia sp. FKR38]|uniref:anti-sigma factor family protein n=1 Tax=Devosia sp. FKR38 TaxID=2562312 RepID=UPI0010C06BE0|nr:zf-HC2 domain-containing protein [Devosia sp. FKR38]
MLSCRELSETATDYLEGALTLRQRVGVTMHLLMCKHCRAYVDQLAKTVSLLKSGQAEQDMAEPDPGVIDAFRKARGKP